MAWGYLKTVMANNRKILQRAHHAIYANSHSANFSIKFQYKTKYQMGLYDILFAVEVNHYDYYELRNRYR